MTICVDISPAVHGRAGLGRYVQELTAALLACDRENEYVAFYNRSGEACVPSPLDRLDRLTSGLGDKPWRTRVLLSHFLHLSQDRLFSNVDLFHATDNLLPRLARVKSVFTLYDLAFRFYPETISAPNRWFLTIMMGRFLRSADMVIAISENTRQGAVRLYGISESKIQVVRGGVSARFHPADPEAIDDVKRRYDLPKSHILFVGTIEPRKNLISLLEAFAALREQSNDRDSAAGGSKLVIVGKKGWGYNDFFRRLRELGLEGEVLFPGFVPDKDLPAVYSAADLFVFPSLYEGFGLPVLEAMACGTPVVCSNTSSLPEVAGDAALLVDPYDVRGLKDALARLLADPSLRGGLVDRGLRRVTQFTWQKTAEQTLAVYRQAFDS